MNFLQSTILNFWVTRVNDKIIFYDNQYSKYYQQGHTSNSLQYLFSIPNYSVTEVKENFRYTSNAPLNFNDLPSTLQILSAKEVEVLFNKKSCSWIYSEIKS